MFTFERTQDLRLVRSIICHRRVYPHLTDDHSPAVEDYQPPAHYWYILAFDGEELLGLWALEPRNAVTAEIHTALLPGHGFRRARTAARELARWIFANTTVRRITTSVPDSNRIAGKFAIDAGMREFGRNKLSYLKNGKLWDQVEYGLSPEDLSPCL